MRQVAICVLSSLFVLQGSSRCDAHGSKSVELQLSWSRPIGAGYAGIAVGGGAAVTLSSDGTDDYVVAFALEDGSELWSVRVGTTFRGKHGAEDGASSTPCIADGRVFVSGPHGRLLALSMATGEQEWAHDLAGEYALRTPSYGYGATPLAVGANVYLPAATADGRAGLAFDAQTGELVWDLRGNWVDYQPALLLNEPTALLALDVTSLYCLDGVSGDVFARFDHRRPTRDLGYPQAVCVGSDGLLLAYEQYSAFYATDYSTEPPLHELWRSRELKDCYTPAVPFGDALYGMSGTFLACVDLATGKRLWKSREPGSRSVIKAGEHLALFASSGDLVLVEPNREGYREAARLRVADGGGYTPAVAAGDLVLVRNTTSIACTRVVSSAGERAVTASPAVEPRGVLAELTASLATSADPGAHLDAWWHGLGDLPLIEEGLVHFLYRGEAEDVALVGDMNVQRYVGATMQPLAGTDLFYRTYEYDPDGLWQYTFLVDFERAVLDPRNPYQARAVVEIGGNPQSLGYPAPVHESVARMPKCPLPPAGLDGSAEGGGSLETLAFRSRSGRFERELSVYVPVGHEVVGATHRAVYVLGGNYWLEDGSIQRALERPAVVVFVPLSTGSRDRLDAGEYADLIVQEIIPLVEANYAVTGPVSILATADDAAAAAIAGFRAPERIDRLALQSPFVDPEDFAQLEPTKGAPRVVYIDWSRYEPRILDENTDRREGAIALADFVRRRGARVLGGEVTAAPGWPSWSSRLDAVLECLLDETPR